MASESSEFYVCPVSALLCTGERHFMQFFLLDCSVGSNALRTKLSHVLPPICHSRIRINYLMNINIYKIGKKSNFNESNMVYTV